MQLNKLRIMHVLPSMVYVKMGKTVITQKCYNSLKEFPSMHIIYTGEYWGYKSDMKLLFKYLHIECRILCSVQCSLGIVFNNLVGNLHSFATRLEIPWIWDTATKALWRIEKYLLTCNRTLLNSSILYHQFIHSFAFY